MPGCHFNVLFGFNHWEQIKHHQGLWDDKDQSECLPLVVLYTWLIESSGDVCDQRPRMSLLICIPLFFSRMSSNSTADSLCAADDQLCSKDTTLHLSLISMRSKWSTWLAAARAPAENPWCDDQTWTMHQCLDYHNSHQHESYTQKNSPLSLTFHLFTSTYKVCRRHID